MVNEKEKIHLYSSPVCPFVQRTKIALRLKSVPYGITEFDLSQPFPAWFIELNPEERVPVIQHGDRVLNESSVINEYLDEIFPEPRLFPEDPHARAVSRVWISWCNDTFIPAMYELMMNDEPSRDETLRLEALATFAKLDQWLLRQNSKSDFPFGQFSMVDLTYAPFFQRYCVNEEYKGLRLPDTDEYRRVRAWIDVTLAEKTVVETGLTREQYLKAYQNYGK